MEPPCYTKSTRVLGSEYIRGRFSERLRDLDEQKARYFLRLFGDVSLVAASVGNLFQGYADRHLSAGGRFLIRSLDTEVDDSIDLSPRPIYYLETFQNAQILLSIIDHKQKILHALIHLSQR